MARERLYDVTVEAKVYKSVMVLACNKQEAARVALGDPDDPRIVDTIGLIHVGTERVAHVARDGAS